MNMNKKGLYAITLILIVISITLSPPLVAEEGSQSIELVALQLEVSPELFSTAESLKEELKKLLEEAEGDLAHRDQRLVVLPEHLGLLMLFMEREGLLLASGSKEGFFARFLLRHPFQFFQIIRLKMGQGLSLTQALLLYQQDHYVPPYFEIFSELAREYKVYLLAGTLPVTPSYLSDFLPSGLAPEGDPLSLYSYSILFDPRGRVVGIQPKVNLTSMEEELGLSAAGLDEVRPISTPLGSLGVAICFDAFFPAYRERLCQQGAEILLKPSANPLPWSHRQQQEWLGGASSSLKEGEFIYAVNPMLVGSLLDLSFEGQSSILATPALKEQLKPEAEARGFFEFPLQPTFLKVSES